MALGLAGLAILYLKPSILIKADTKNIVIETNTNSSQWPKDDIAATIAKVKSVHEVLADAQSYDSVFIVGDGLSKDDLTLLDSFHLKYFPSDKLPGFVQIDLPTVRQNTNWSLKGKVNPSKSQKVVLSLNDERAIESYPDEEGQFELQMKNPIAGHFTYQIEAIYEDTTITESLPIKVLPTTKWNLLAYSSAPSFELNYLKNYWVKLGNGFSLRQQVSISRFKESFVNAPKTALDKIDRNLLSKFNFLLIDALSWEELNKEEQDLVLNYVYTGRIALLFFGLSDGDELDRIISNQIKSAAEPQNQDIKFSKINTPKGFYNLYSNKTSAAAVKNYGIGYIGLMTTTDSYKYILAGQDVNYQNQWASIFSKLFISSPDDVIITSPVWNWEAKHSILNVYANKEIDPTALVNDQELNMVETQGQDGMYKLVVEPKVGWNTVKLESREKPYRFYAHNQDNWRAMNQRSLHEINAVATARNTASIGQDRFIQKELPFIYGFLLAVFGLCSLWLHERIFMSK